MTQTIKCPSCGDVHALDKERLTKNGPDQKNVLRTGYRTECEGCGDPFEVLITITDVGTKTEKATVGGHPMSEHSRTADERNAIADEAREDFAAEAAIIGADAAKAIAEKYDLSGDLSERVGVAIAREFTEQAVQLALKSLYDAQTEAKRAEDEANAEAGADAVAKL